MPDFSRTTESFMLADRSHDFPCVISFLQGHQGNRTKDILSVFGSLETAVIPPLFV
jgi:hypothetical protein